MNWDYLHDVRRNEGGNATVVHDAHGTCSGSPHWDVLKAPRDMFPPEDVVTCHRTLPILGVGMDARLNVSALLASELGAGSQRQASFAFHEGADGKLEVRVSEGVTAERIQADFELLVGALEPAAPAGQASVTQHGRLYGEADGLAASRTGFRKQIYERAIFDIRLDDDSAWVGEVGDRER